MKGFGETLFKGKKITVVGLGLLGRGVGDITFLAECGADLIVTDIKTHEQLAPSLKKLEKFPNIAYTLGEHMLEDFRGRDLVIKSANIPLDSEFIAEARKEGIPVTTAEALFVKHVPDIVSVGVTGTRGKTTTTYLIYEILKAAGERVHLGGNVQGVATLPLMKKVKKGDLVVLELDSWRLQGFGDEKVSPHVSVFTSFMVDHQNYYKGDMDAYFADKENIFKFQTASDLLVTTRELLHRAITEADVVVAKKALPRGWKLSIPGIHNAQNAALALEVVRALGVSDTISKKVFAKFAGVPGRLQMLGKKDGVLYVNDTTATTPDALFAALDAYKAYKGKVVLIGGGADKALDYAEYGKQVPKYIKTLVLFEGVASEKIVAALPAKKKFSVGLVHSMKEAVSLASGSAKKGDLVLLSPAAASFGLFKNEYDRGDQFVREFKRL